jgi:4-amino-4-deoxy-L-arabinose transferase-like glycosyltransferase
MRRAAFVVFALALAVRLLHLWAVAATPLLSLHTDFPESDMYMFDQWSRALAGGDWLAQRTPHFLYQWQLDVAPEDSWRRFYGDPLTFYKAPFYAYLLAVLRRLLGDPMLPAALLQCLASSVSAVLLLQLGRRLFSPGAGLAAGLLFAVYAPAVHFDSVLLRGPFVVLAALLATLAIARLAADVTPRRAAAAGAAVGGALLVYEGFTPVVPLVLALLPVWSASGRACLRGAAAFVAGCLAGLLPVVARNLWVGAPPLSLAVTGGVVYAAFNVPEAAPWGYEVPREALRAVMDATDGGFGSVVLACLARYASPAAALRFYAERGLALLIPFENPDNVNLYYAALHDPLLGWLPGFGVLLPLSAAGLVFAWRRRRALLPLLPFAATLLASILLTAPTSRYRVVLAVFLFPLAGHALAAARAAWREPARARLLVPCIAGAAAALAAAAQEARLDRRVGLLALRYRPVEFYVGARLLESRGDFAGAAAEMVRLVRANRHPAAQAWALQNAGRLLALAGQRSRAAEMLGAAADLGRKDARLLLAVGDALRGELADPQGAEAAWRRALALSPGAPLDAELRDRLGSLAAAPGPR